MYLLFLLKECGRGVMMSGINKINQSGATMIEAIAVIAIAIMLGVSVISLINSIYAVFTQNMVAGEVRDLQKAISDIYRFDGNYSALGSDENSAASYLCNNKIAPFQMCVRGKLKSRSGGEVSVKVYNDDVSDQDDKYEIVFTGLSRKTCVNAVQINWDKGQRSVVYAMVVNSDNSKTVWQLKNATNEKYTFPVSTSVAMELCSKEYDNTIQYVFY